VYGWVRGQRSEVKDQKSEDRSECGGQSAGGGADCCVRDQKSEDGSGLADKLMEKWDDTVISHRMT
jgi:hypothetical protein